MIWYITFIYCVMYYIICKFQTAFVLMAIKLTQNKVLTKILLWHMDGNPLYFHKVHKSMLLHFIQIAYNTYMYILYALIKMQTIRGSYCNIY